MDCIFKALGYVPKNCTSSRCDPLEKLLFSAGLTKEAAIKSSDIIRQAYEWLALEDEIRDAPIKKKIIAKALSRPYLATLPKAIRHSLKKLNLGVRQLENSCVNPVNYIETLSSLSGSLFEEVGSLFKEAGSNETNKRLNSMGAIIAGAILLHDMTKDLPLDARTHKFNPLRNYNSDETKALARRYTSEFKKLADPILINISTTLKKEETCSASLSLLLHSVISKIVQLLIVVKSFLYKKSN